MTTRDRSSSVYVIAEAGVNHNGSLDKARGLIDAAAAAGANAVKFQTFSADRLASPAARMADYQVRNTGVDEPQLEMLRRLELSREAHVRLMDHCRSRKIDFLSSPFDMQSASFLVDELGLDTIKVPSGEITNGPMLFALARRKVDLIISTGMADFDEIARALDLVAWGYAGSALSPSVDMVGAREVPSAREALTSKVTVLQCTSEYPAPFDSIDLRSMATLRERFALPVGLSDHSDGIAVPIAAAALGARIIEKHLTLDRSLPGPDHKASLEPKELEEMIRGIRSVELALGDGNKVCSDVERTTRALVRKGLVASQPIGRGEIFTEQNLVAQRPERGTSPMLYWSLLGRSAPRDYAAGEPVEL